MKGEDRLSVDLGLSKDRGVLPGSCVRSRPVAAPTEGGGKKGRANARPEMCLIPRGMNKGSGSLQGVFSGEIFITQIVGNRFMIDMPCMNVKTISQVRVAS